MKLENAVTEERDLIGRGERKKVNFLSFLLLCGVHNEEYFVARNFMCFDMHYEEKEKTWQAHYESVLELERWLCRELGV